MMNKIGESNNNTLTENNMSKVLFKEEEILLQLREDRDHINFLRAAPLMAHNFGDLDRVIVQWGMEEE